MRLSIVRTPPGRSVVIALSLAFAIVGLMGQGLLQAGGFFRNAAVGGVAIDADGVLSSPTVADMEALRVAVAERITAVPQDMDTGLVERRISLKMLEQALQQSTHRDLGQLPDEIKYLAGLQRIQYVLVYPEQQDIVLVGPGEGWQINERGHVVGKTTGRPVIQLEDLLVAFQATFHGEEGISCSIDPTEQGTLAMRQFVRDQKQFSPQAVQGIAESLGPQQITITGVPETSHFARVLVAADYRMKRIAMRLEPSPLPTLPSFLEMLAGSRVKLTNMMPRWWLACDYEPLARSEDGLAWEIRGQGVQVKTEDSIIAQDGSFQRVEGRENPLAAEWAETMTRQYEQVSEKDAVFAQLRSLMDLAVVAALVRQEALHERAGCSLPTLVGENHDFALQAWNPPKSVATECSFVKRGKDYLITASGGVQIDAWKFAGQSQVSPQMANVLTKTEHQPNRWWW
jgi:hypothetical protein